MEEALIKRVMPHDEEAESSVIGAMLIDNEAIMIASEIITGEDFYQKQMGMVYDTMVELYNEGKPVEPVILHTRLLEKGLPEEACGITKTLAKNIVAYREANGRFADRRQLLKVSKLGPKAFEQCAGFLRIMNGDNPLDTTSVHPESYEAAMKLLTSLGYSPEDIAGGGLKGISKKVLHLKETA